MSNSRYKINYGNLADDYDKVNWWFHEDLTYDTVIFQTHSPYAYKDNLGNKEECFQPITLIYLVERYTIWEYKWADEYSYFLFDLLKTKNLLPRQTPENIDNGVWKNYGVTSTIRAALLIGYNPPRLYYNLDTIGQSVGDLQKIKLPKTNKPEEIIITFLYLSEKKSMINYYQELYKETMDPDLEYSRFSSNAVNFNCLEQDGLLTGPGHPASNDSINLKSTFGKHYIKLYTSVAEEKEIDLKKIIFQNPVWKNINSLKPSNDYPYQDTFKYGEMESQDGPFYERNSNFIFGACKFSFVVSSDDESLVSLVESAFPYYYLYKNRDRIDSVLPKTWEYYNYKNEYTGLVNAEIWSEELYKLPLGTPLVEEDPPAYWVATKDEDTKIENYNPLIVGKVERSRWYEVNAQNEDEGIIIWKQINITATKKTYELEYSKTNAVALIPAYLKIKLHFKY